VRAIGEAVRDAAGKIVRIEGAFQDITERKQAEDALREKEALIRIAGRLTRTGGWAASMSDQRVFWSDEICDLLEYPRGNALQLPDALAVHPDSSRDQVTAAMAACGRDGTPFDLEVETVTATGRRIWGRVCGEAEREADRSIHRIQGAFQDITERKQAEEALRASEERFSSAFAHAAIGMVLASIEGRYIQVNRAMCELLGYTEAELLARNFQEISHPDDLAADLEKVGQLLAGAVESYQMEKRNLRKDGQVVWISLSVSLLRDETGQPRHFIAQVKDITGRKEAEAELLRQQTELRMLFDYLPALIMFKDTNNRILRVNRRVADAIGKTVEEMEGRPSGDYYAAADQFYADDLEVIRSRAPKLGIVESFRDKDGRETWIRTNKVPFFNQAGEVTGVVVLAEDISEHREAEQQLREAAQRLQLATKVTGTGVWDWDLVTNRVVWDEQMFSLYGFDAAGGEVPSEMWANTVLPEDRAEQLAILQETARQGGRSERKFRIRRVNDGAIRIIYASEMAVTEAGGRQHVVGVSRDVTDIERAAEKLATSEERFRLLAKATQDAIWDWDLNTNALWWNEGYETLFGYRREEADPSIKSWSDFIHPEDLARVTGSAHRVIDQGEESWSSEYRFRCADASYVYVLDRSHVIRDAEGKAVRMIGGMTDLSEQKRAEEEREEMNQQLVKASRQAGMAEVATSVLHNVGNVLNSVNVSATLASDKIRRSCGSDVGRIADLFEQHRDDLPGFLASPQGTKLPTFLKSLSQHLGEEQGAVLAELQSLQAHIGHIKEIVGMQQTHARLAGATEELPAAGLLEEALRLNAATLHHHGVEVTRDYGEPRSLTVDKHKALQIFVNLIRNAAQAMDAPDAYGKRLTLRIGGDGSGFVGLAVGDEGGGISAENMKRIFEHGFTTRAEGHGFGLHSAALAAKELGGALTVHSDGPGTGALFTLKLPPSPVRQS